MSYMAEYFGCLLMLCVCIFVCVIESDVYDYGRCCVVCVGGG